METLSLEKQVAIAAVHAEQQRKVLAKTGGEVMHPDHYEFRQGLRDAVMQAIDESVIEHRMAKLKDKHLPELFECIDSIAEQLFNERYLN